MQLAYQLSAQSGNTCRVTDDSTIFFGQFLAGRGGACCTTILVLRVG